RLRPHTATLFPYTTLFRSPLDPKTQQIVEGDVRAQAERVMENLAAVLSAAGASFATVVKATIFLADLNDFAAVNEVYGKRFPSADRKSTRLNSSHSQISYA